MLKFYYGKKGLLRVGGNSRIAQKGLKDIKVAKTLKMPLKAFTKMVSKYSKSSSPKTIKRAKKSQKRSKYYK